MFSHACRKFPSTAIHPDRSEGLKLNARRSIRIAGTRFARSSKTGRDSVAEPRNVLVVEDDEALCQIVEARLRAEGFEVWTARDGVHGYSCYLYHPTELVVTDVQMPELNGFAMMRCIRAINPGVRAVYITGAADRFRADLEFERRQFGAVVIEKPFSREKLIAAMRGRSVASRLPSGAK
jgi:DNA-binding NtrC family response regulator